MYVGKKNLTDQMKAVSTGSSDATTSIPDLGKFYKSQYKQEERLTQCGPVITR
jgi:hypothetical protein